MSFPALGNANVPCTSLPEIRRKKISSWQRKCSMHQVCQKFEEKNTKAGKGNVACTNLPEIRKKKTASHHYLWIIAHIQGWEADSSSSSSQQLATYLIVHKRT
jgi:hypothetical protein